jgi:hypothetical protein
LGHVVVLGIENFLHLFGKIDVGEQGSIGFATTSGQLLVRYPFVNRIWRDFSRSLNFSALLLKPEIRHGVL